MSIQEKIKENKPSKAHNSTNFQIRRSSQPMAAPPQTLKIPHKLATAPNPACLEFSESLQLKEFEYKICDLMNKD